MVKVRLAKSGLPPIAAIRGVTRSFTSPVTSAAKAAPMTKATARSTRFPRSRNFLKPPIRQPFPSAPRTARDPGSAVTPYRSSGRRGVTAGRPTALFGQAGDRLRPQEELVRPQILDGDDAEG